MCRWADSELHREDDSGAKGRGTTFATPVGAEFGFPIDLGVRQPELLKADEVAERLRCDVSTVYELFRSGRLTGFSLTGNVDLKKRGRKGLRFFAASVDVLISGAIAEYEAVRVRAVPPAGPAAPPPVLPPPLLKPGPRPRAGSRVVLPPPP